MKKKAPPIPDYVDMRDLPFFPIYITRLLNSRFHLITHDATTWKAGMILWFKSWHQSPAGTLPESDQELMALAEIHDKSTWERIREGALYGWKTGENGHLYHKALNEIVLRHNQKRYSASRHASIAAQARWAAERKKKEAKNNKKKQKDNAQRTARAVPVDAIKGKESKVKESTSSTTPAAAAPRPPVDKSETQDTFMRYPIVGANGAEAFVDVPESKVLQWERVFPRVDVRQKLRELELWATDNPGKRKTAAIALPHLASCMERQQRRAELEQYSSVPAGAYVPRGPSVRSAGVSRWWETAGGITDKGAGLGVKQAEDEPFPYFKARVFDAAGAGPWNQVERERAVADETIRKITTKEPDDEAINGA